MLKVRIEKDKIVGVDGRVFFKHSDFNAHEEVIEFGVHPVTRLPRQLSDVFRIYEGWYFSATKAAESVVGSHRCEVQLCVNDLAVAQTSLISLFHTGVGGVETALYERGRFPAAFLVENSDTVEIRVTHGSFFNLSVRLYVHLYGRRHQAIL